MICFYHSRDLDGWCSAAIIKTRYPDCELIGYDYGQSFPCDKIAGQKVIMVDVSLQPFSEMLKLASLCKLTWIDHHIGAINDYISWNGPPGFEFVRFNEKLSACELTWGYCFGIWDIPKAITLLGRYDTFRKEEGDWENETLPFQYGMRAVCNSPETFLKKAFLRKLLQTPIQNHTIYGIIAKGKAILKYQSQIDETTAKKAFEVNFEGHKTIAINGIQFTSLTFKSIPNLADYDILMMFQYEGSINQWKFSIYTEKDNVDCMTLAKKYGGGGHRKASGFQLTKEQFNNLLNI